MQPWDRQDGETKRAYARFLAFVDLGPDRTVATYAELCGLRFTGVKAAADRGKWVKRARAYDSHHLAEKIASRKERQERVREYLMAHATEAAEVLLSVTTGQPLEGERDTTGRPIVSARDRLTAARAALELAGIVVPKRMELTGPDGADLLLKVRAGLSAIDSDALAAIAKALGVDSGDQSG